MKSKSEFFKPLCAVLLLTLAPGLAATCTAQDFIELTSDERQRLGIVTAPVRKADTTQGILVPGSVISSPLQSGQLIALYDGVVVRWLVPAGEVVSAGSSLVEIQSPTLLALQREWMQAQVALEQVRFDMEKDTQLFADGVISRRRLEETQRTLRNAEFARQASAGALEAAGFNEASLELLGTSGSGLGSYTITAATEGVLSKRVLEAGERVEAGARIGEVTAGGSVWVEFSAPASFLRRLQTGQSLSTASGDGLVIRMLDRAVNTGTQTFDVHAEITTQNMLMPGEIVNVVLADNAEGVWVPGSAVVHNDHDTLVFVNTLNGVEVRNLSLLPSGSGYVAESGLAAGDEIVVQGTAVLKGITLGLGGE